MTGVEERRSTSLRAFAPALALLAISVFINYIDRGNLSVAAPLLKAELHISGAQLGLLLAAFFWTYTGLQFVIGWAVDRFDVNRVLATGFLLWSLATVCTGFVGGFASLFLVRLVLGVGESVAFPSYSKILAQHLPEHHRGLGNAVIIASLRFGPAVGMFGAGLLIAHYGWRPVFIGIGAVSLLWLPAWRRWMPRGERVGGAALEKATTVRQILRNRSFWGASAGHFCANYQLYFFVMWLPFYLMTERHLTMTQMAEVAGIYYALSGITSLLAGWAADHAIRAGTSTTLARKSVMVLGHATTAIGLLGCALPGPHSYLPYLMITGIGEGAAGSGIYAFSQTLAGRRMAGRWVGLQNGFANFAGLIAPALSGFLLDWSGHLAAALVVSAGVALAGGFSWAFVVGRLETTAPVSAPPLEQAANDAA